jgi:hypothetical protein
MKFILRLIKDFVAKQEAKQKVSDIETRKETILFNLITNVPMQESIEMYNSISETFVDKVKKRGMEVTVEKNAIDKFLKDL